MQHLPWKALHPSQVFPIHLLTLFQAGIPAAGWEEQARDTELTPWLLRGESGLGAQTWVQPVPTLHFYSPPWWVAKQLSQLFPETGLHQEASPLSLLEKEIFLCRKLVLESRLAAWEGLLGN